MISDFITQVKTRGIARTNHYEVVIPFPSQNSTAQRLANLFCDTVTLPGLNIATTPSNIYGESREMPYNRNFEPVQMSFYVDSGLELKTQFDSWMENIVNPNTRAIGYYKDYIAPVHIYVKTIDGQAPYMITLHEAYPKTVNSITLDTASRDIMKMSITLQYKFWTYISIPMQSSSSQVRLANRLQMVPSLGGGFPLPGSSSQDPSQVNTGFGFSNDSDFLSDSNFQAYDTFDAPTDSNPRLSRSVDSIQSIRDATFRAQLLAQSDIGSGDEFDF